jgi:NitT/TauT family transport system substrate-binding protein
MTPGPGTIQHFLLLKYLGDNSIDVGEVTIDTPVAPNLMLEKLGQGTADAFVAWEPFVSEAVVGGTGQILVYSSEIWSEHICCVLAADADFAKKHKAAVVGFLKAHLEAIDWINNALADNSSTDYQKLVGIAADFTQRDEETVKEALKNMEYNGALDTTFKNFFTAFVEELIDQGTILDAKLQERGYSNAADVTAKYIDDSFMQEATS